eukprot:CAMPEP_0118927436 /NCGR_PEP_ID=MMETSP1169-20130426/4905_1 /TAXON_ID=36882 /ORGANISM="Pyramimonas obovata, Strain CCMP722" /LENGTH=469 /DNA_ID=CAMNT_0006869193 /DNA_START=293 /DNA_END=1699 /DNA_ORIENTATION=+
MHAHDSPGRATSGRVRTHATGASNLKSSYRKLADNPLVKVTTPPQYMKPNTRLKNYKKTVSYKEQDSFRELSPAEATRALEHVVPLQTKTREDYQLVTNMTQKIQSLCSQAALRTFFHKCDKKHTGRLSYRDLFMGLTKFNFNISKDNYARLFKSLDTDRSGDIDYDEFVTFFEHTYPLMPPEARYLDKWQKEQTTDNTMTAAPYATDVPVVEKGLNACLDLFHKGAFVPEPGSWAERQADKKVFQTIASRLEESSSSIRHHFRRFDVDKNGSISREEFKTALGALNAGLTPNQIDRFTTQVDADGSDNIEYEEFAKMFDLLQDGKIKPTVQRAESASSDGVRKEGMMAGRSQMQKENDASEIVKTLRNKILTRPRRLLAAMREYEDEQGQLSPQDFTYALRTVMPLITGDEVRTFLEAYDKNKDGRISVTEFMDIFESLPDDTHLGAPMQRSQYYYTHSMAPTGPMVG